MEKNIIIVDTHNAPWAMLKNVDYCYPVQIIQNERFTKTKIMTLIKKIHLSYKVNRVINLPFKSIWSRAFKNFEWSDGEYIALFGANTIFPLSYRYLNKIKMKHNIHYVLFLSDAVESSTSYAYDLKKYIKKVKFDKILSFDFKDVENNKNNGFELYFPPYKIMTIDFETKSCLYDIVWFGTPSERYDLLMKVHEYLIQNGVKVMFEMRMSKSPYKADEDIKTIKYFKEKRPYSDIVKLDLSSNCILEIPLSAQTGSTYRYYEAICYNKKLLTTNKYVVNMPFYNPRYIKVFEKPEDIDINWLITRENVDYGYDGRFSPERFLNGIVENFETTD